MIDPAAAAEARQAGPRHRLFLALRPDPATAARIAAFSGGLSGDHGLPPAPPPVDRLHVTLNYFGVHPQVPAGLTEAVDAAATGLGIAPIDVVLDRVASFDGHRGARPWVMLPSAASAAALQQLYAALAARLRAHGVEGESGRRAFTPHLTLRRVAAPLPAQAVAPIAWQADAVLLVDSRVGRSEHHVLGRWPLVPA
jgi:RNA 2',3'-cyclic 3'-phosphodiesterase